MRDVLVKAEWFEEIKNAPEEIQKELFYRIIKVGCFEEEVDTQNDEWGVSNAWFNLKGHIDRMKDAHNMNVENGRKNGRKIMADPQLVYDYCQENPKAKVNEVGIALNLPQSVAGKGPYAYLYDNEGWKNRKTPGWIYGEDNKNSESDSEIGKNFPKADSEKNSFSENSSENFSAENSEIGKNFPFEF